MAAGCRSFAEGRLSYPFVLLQQLRSRSWRETRPENTSVAQPRSDSAGSCDLSFLRVYLGFHSHLSLQALEISRDGQGSESATSFLVHSGAIAGIEAPIDLDGVPLLGMAHVIDSYVVVLTPEEWNSIELFAPAENVFGCDLSHAFSYHPVLDANSLAGVRIWPARGIAGSEDSSSTGFQILVDCDTSIDRESGLFGQSQ